MQFLSPNTISVIFFSISLYSVNWKCWAERSRLYIVELLLAVCMLLLCHNYNIFAVRMVPVFWHTQQHDLRLSISQFGHSRNMYTVTYVTAAWFMGSDTLMRSTLCPCFWFFIPTLNWYMQRCANFVKLSTCTKFPPCISKTQCDLYCLSYFFVYISIFLLSPSLFLARSVRNCGILDLAKFSLC